MEIAVLSAQGLKSASSRLFSHRLRPFITIKTYPPPIPSSEMKCCQVYSTRIDDQGGVNPTWGDKFHVPVDTAAFLANAYSCIFLEIYTKRLMKGNVLLGWCQIPVADIGFSPGNSVRYLSYRVRARDGTRGQGIVNLAIKFTGFEHGSSERLRLSSNTINPPDYRQASEGCQAVIGIPVSGFSCMNYHH